MSQLPSSKKHHSPSGEHDLAYAILVLERQLDAYQRLHEEDMASLRAALQEIKTLLINQNDFSVTLSTSDDPNQPHYHSS